MPDWLLPLLTFSYWFTPYPAALVGAAFWVVVGAAAGSFGLGLVVRLAASFLGDASTRRILQRLGALGMTMGALTAVSFFFTQTSTPTLGSRFWFLLWLLIASVWLWFILRYAVKVAPQERAERAKQQEIQKYLPH